MSRASAAKLEAQKARFIPWEDRSEASRWRLGRSWLMLITQPSEFYRRMGLRGGLGEPLSFQMLCAWLAAVILVVQVYLAYLITENHSWINWFPGWREPLAFTFNMACVLVLVTPAVALCRALVCLIKGVLARLVGGRGPRGAGVEAYFSIFAYAWGPVPLVIVPGLGAVAAVVLYLVLLLKGMRHAVGLGLGPSLAAMILPQVILALPWVALLVL